MLWREGKPRARARATVKVSRIIKFFTSNNTAMKYAHYCKCSTSIMDDDSKKQPIATTFSPSRVRFRKPSSSRHHLTIPPCIIDDEDDKQDRLYTEYLLEEFEKVNGSTGNGTILPFQILQQGLKLQAIS